MSVSIAKLNKLAKQLSSQFQNINRGGCGIVAEAMYRALSDHIHHINIVFKDYWCCDDDGHCHDDGHRAASQVLQQFFRTNKHGSIRDFNNETGLMCSHAYITFKHRGTWYMFDTDEGVTRLDKYHNHTLGTTMKVPRKVVRKIVDRPEGWNTKFDRRQIPAIRRIIRQADVLSN